MCTSLPVSENKGGKSKQRKQSTKSTNVAKNMEFGKREKKKFKHCIREDLRDEYIKVAQNQSMKKCEYPTEEYGLYCGENGEPLEVSEKRSDDQAHSINQQGYNILR